MELIYTAGWFGLDLERPYAAVYLIHATIASSTSKERLSSPSPSLSDSLKELSDLLKKLTRVEQMAQLRNTLVFRLPKSALRQATLVLWQVLFLRYVVCASLETNPGACLGDGTMSWIAVFLASVWRRTGLEVLAASLLWLIYGVRVGLFGKAAAEFLDRLILEAEN